MAHSEYIVSKTPGGELSPPVKPRKFATGKDVINHTMVASLLERRKLIKSNTTSPVVEGFRCLIDNKILCIPLYDIERRSYAGFMDIIDVAHHFLSAMSAEEVKTGYSAWHKKFSSLQNKDVMDVSKRNPWMGVDSVASLQAVIDLIVHYKVHRIPIVDSDGELQAVLSQSRVAQYLVQYLDLFDWTNKTVDELKLGYRQVVVVPNSMVTKDAFKVMRDTSVSGVGVVDDAQKLVGVLSTSDLRHVGYSEHMFDRFYLTVQDFLTIVHGSEGHNIPRVVVAVPSSTVTQVGELFMKHKVHRVFVVDSEQSMKVLGVISLHDFLLLFGRSIH